MRDEFSLGYKASCSFPVFSIILHAGFYFLPYKGHFPRFIGTSEYLPLAIASWTVSKVLPACFTTLRQVILFEALVPILASTQGFLLGLGVDVLLRRQTEKRG
jgi:hypothetical protein